MANISLVKFVKVQNNHFKPFTFCVDCDQHETALGFEWDTGVCPHCGSDKLYKLVCRPVCYHPAPTFKQWIKSIFTSSEIPSVHFEYLERGELVPEEVFTYC